MAEGSSEYVRAVAVTSAGLTLNSGVFKAILTPTGSVTITAHPVRNAADAGITFTSVAGAIYPIKCDYLKPASGTIYGLM
jgi:hypothetical protein